jgi:hypothetical protein
MRGGDIRGHLDGALDLSAKLKSHIVSERTLAEHYVSTKHETVLAVPPLLMLTPNDVGSTMHLHWDELLKLGLIAEKAMWAVHLGHDLLNVVFLFGRQFHLATLTHSINSTVIIISRFVNWDLCLLLNQHRYALAGSLYHTAEHTGPYHGGWAGQTIHYSANKARPKELKCAFGKA